MMAPMAFKGNVGNLLLAADSKPAAVLPAATRLFKTVEQHQYCRMCNFRWNLAWLCRMVLAMLVFVTKPMIQRGPKCQSLDEGPVFKLEGGYLSGFSC